MNVINLVLQIFEIVLFVYLAFASVYIFVFGFFSIFPYKHKVPEKVRFRKFAVLIPGYKEDAVIVEVAADALKQNYPKDKFEIVVIADSFQEKTLQELRKLDIRVVEVSFEKSTKSKALNSAMKEIGDDYDIALILDADNLMAENFLELMNESFERNYLAVQGHRVAKNTNTSMAVLDAVSEEINNSLFRKAHRKLGLSSALIGSGMAFKYDFFKKIMSEIKAIGGFDKELELRLLKDGNKIEYINEAIVYDEKVQKDEVFANQRRRWLSAQFVYFRRFFFQGLYKLFTRGNIDFFDKVYQMIQPPRILLLGVLGFIVVISAFFTFIMPETLEGVFYTGFYHWLFAFGLTFMAFLFAIPSKFYSKSTLKAILYLPRGFVLMFLSLMKIRGANKRFIHTAHGLDDESKESGSGN